VAEAGEEGFTLGVQLQADLQQPVGLPPGPPGQLQGEAVGEDLPRPSQLGKLLGQDHGGPRAVGSPAWPSPRGVQSTSPLATPARAGRGEARTMPKAASRPSRKRWLEPTRSKKTTLTKRLSAGRSTPRARPQAMQNRASGGFFWPQAQRISLPKEHQGGPEVDLGPAG
jgi:hypothetical protein